MRIRMALVWLLCLASAAQAQDKTGVMLGTATPGGGFPVYGAAFTATINEFEPSLVVEPRNTRGSAETPSLGISDDPVF